MCGRYSRSRSRNEYAAALGMHSTDHGGDLVPVWNMPPGMCSLVWRRPPNFAPGFDSIWWGLVPRWSREKTPRSNARSETVAELPSFKDSLRARRCLIPADGFEWQRGPAGKVPHYITHAGGEPLFFAGIWDEWHRPPLEAHPGYAVLTTGPNELMAPIHDRMPVIVRPEHRELWMDPQTPLGALTAVYEPFPAEEMRAWPVSSRVNNTKNNDPDLLKPIAAASAHAYNPAEQLELIVAAFPELIRPKETPGHG